MTTTLITITIVLSLGAIVFAIYSLTRTIDDTEDFDDRER